MGIDEGRRGFVGVHLPSDKPRPLPQPVKRPAEEGGGTVFLCDYCASLDFRSLGGRAPKLTIFCRNSFGENAAPLALA